MNWMTETSSYLDGKWKYYISIEFWIVVVLYSTHAEWFGKYIYIKI